jgi:antitoxin component YwqK of YwqJK toxin-antitoxin module
MRYCLLSLVLFLGCTGPGERIKTPPDVFIESTDTALHNLNASWYTKGARFNGYIIEKAGNKMVSKLPILDGKENGWAYGWYNSGKPKFKRYYVNGNREGRHTGWYENGRLSFELSFHNDKYEGMQKTFFKSGNLWQALSYVSGYEEGRQKTWSDSGRVINNFTVKNGKLYGVIGRYDCMSVMQK